MPDDQVIESPDPVLETQAREMGWRPEEEFKGEKSKWVDAKTFVDRGEHVLPIVKATADRLRKDLVTTNSQLTEVREALKASQETIAALEKYHQDDVKQKVDQARARLKADLVAAKRSGDVESEVELTEELTSLNAADQAAAALQPKGERPGGKKAPAKDYTQEPDFVSWREDNPWFGSDQAKTAIAQAVTWKLRESGDTTIGRAFLDKVSLEVTKEVQRLAGGRATSKVEAGKGGSGSTGGGGGGGKSYADLPPDAKAACDSFARDLVGANRKYATKDEWQKAYAKQYFTEV